ncbi:hypothetical protein RHOFW104T7_05045 [Rhodanobacter thiooxydans]|uniref:Uncharacterized protein n=2 Tax=Rhodanobacter thiooxydans TaxID=416169 RepID=A0A154QLS7_9GAMM|nr:hypothetical protein UUA_17320 [Rhodanobacter thiooxydans LCS2]KZC25159.1 hypothetical protein RHOFW104T7_05045 [Rhodanobacter thiooxydans]
MYPGDALQAQESIQRLQSVVQDGLGSLQGGVSQLQQSMNVLQGLQVANLALSGLNLAVSAAGFVIVCRKLDKVSAQIQEQSKGIAQTLRLVGEAHDRSLLGDEARFRSLLLSAKQFCEQGDVEHLKSLVPTFHHEYQFTKLVLEKYASSAASSMSRFGEIALLQDRLMNIGLMLSHVQMRSGAPKYGQECLIGLADDISTLNKCRIEALSGDRDVASQMTVGHLAEVTSFLERGKRVVPALTYESDLIGLEIAHPGVLDQASESKEILMFAA